MRFAPLATTIAAAVVLAGCSGGPQAAPTTTTVVTVTADPAQTVASSARLDRDGLPRVSVVVAGNRCIVDAGRVQAGSVRFSLFNADSSFADLAVRDEGGAAKDIYRLPNVGPSATAEMTVKLDAGSYSIACVGDREDIGRSSTLVVD